MSIRIIAAGAAAAAALTAGAAAFAGPPGGFAPTERFASSPSGLCALRVEGGAIVALAAPRGAEEWSLSLRAPGLQSDQGGDLHGWSTRLEPLSRTVIIDTQPEPGRLQARIDSEDVLKRPLRARLVVTGANGRTVCADELHLRPLGGGGRPGRPF